MHFRPTYRISAGILLTALLGFGLVWAWESGQAVSIPLSALTESRSADAHPGSRIQDSAGKSHHCHHSTALFPAQSMVGFLICLPFSSDAFAPARSADLQQAVSCAGRDPPGTTRSPA